MSDAAAYAAFTAPFEGRHLKVYKDSLGIETVGVGFNLRRPGSREALQLVGANLSDVLQGKPLTDRQVDQLFAADIAAAAREAARLFRSFAAQPLPVRCILVDLVFNLGATTLAKFRRFIAAIDARRYAVAAGQLIFRNPPAPAFTGYFRQTGNRAASHAAALVSFDEGVAA